MTFHHATLHEARAALDTIERGRLTVVAEIDLPRWYWAGLALGWIGLGLVADLGYGWVTVAATFAFGTAHAAVARRVLSGRRLGPVRVHPRPARPCRTPRSPSTSTLEDAGYIDIDRPLNGRRRRVQARLTPEGRAAFHGHIAALREIVANADPQNAFP